MSDNERVISAGRDATGKFTSGPENIGRPKGVKNKRTIEALRRVQEMDADAMSMLHVKVLQGDMQAITYVLDRVIAKSRTISIDGLTANDVVELAREGVLTTAEMKDFASAIEKLRKIDDLDELRAKLAELERYVRQ